MKTLYLDCISGIAGDMTLAALIDLGADIDYIRRQLEKLPIDPFEMHVHTVVKKGIAAKQLHLHIGGGSAKHHHDEHHHDEHHHDEHHHDEHHHDEHHHDEHHHDEHHHDEHHHDEHHHDEHRRASSILSMITGSDLPARVKLRSTAVFRVIAEAEGKIHGISPDDVHFHEVGAMDSIIDTIGVCLALESLGIDEIRASAVPTGQGKVRMAHGLYPIPAPATAELLTGVPLSRLEVQGELTTPTGAGILKALAVKFGPLDNVTIDRIGYGAGEKEFDHPNVLRAVLVHDSVQAALDEFELSDGRERVYVLEAQVDDMTGEALGFSMDKLFEAGALDVFYTPVYMKKNRPGTLISLLAAPDTVERCEEVMLLHTSTLGVRRSVWNRRILGRRMVDAVTPYGVIRVKQAFMHTKLVHQAPEYEDVAAAAKRHAVSFQDVYQAALASVPVE